MDTGNGVHPKRTYCYGTHYHVPLAPLSVCDSPPEPAGLEDRACVACVATCMGLTRVTPALPSLHHGAASHLFCSAARASPAQTSTRVHVRRVAPMRMGNAFRSETPHAQRSSVLVCSIEWLAVTITLRTGDWMAMVNTSHIMQRTMRQHVPHCSGARPASWR